MTALDTGTTREPRPIQAAGAGTLLRFALRRERFTLPWWIFGLGALLALQSVSSQRLYDTPEKLDALRRTMGGNAAVVALGGPLRLLDTIGGEVLFEIFTYLAIVIALMNMFLVGRHTRTDEETGRAELIRSARVGRRAALVAALLLAVAANAVAAVAVCAVAVGTGLPVGGSLLLGAVLAGTGVTFAAVTAVAAQVFENPRSVYGAVSLALAAAWVLRAVGDVGNGTASWLSPIGWGQRSYPYVVDRWWPLLLFAAATAVLFAVAVWLLDRRDFGSGLFAYGTGRATASPALRSPASLAWRLQRGALIGWVTGVFGLGLAYGSFADSIEDFIADNPDIAAFLPGGADDAVDSYLALSLSTLALLTAAYTVTAVLRARGEETEGRADPLLAAPVGRTTWFAGHLSVALIGSAAVLAAGGVGVGLSHGMITSTAAEPLRLAAAALAYLPAAWLVAAVAALAYGWLPRLATPVSWVYFAYCAVATLFAESFDLPAWFDQAAPFAHLPRVPLDDPRPGPLLTLLALTGLGMLAALAGLRRRDIGY
ncbi:ABC transporter permease [Nocardia otitidiscaviarum]|uniref:ABC transporter permease n=1 Tax=Nocardia otitidiscaviarum TaxID=1823 RepID=UPI002B4B8474|nr:ABC transporter permease [Nocardia otitidiscaviarum]